MSRGMKKIMEKARNQDSDVIATENVLVLFRSVYLRINKNVMARTMTASVDGTQI